MRREDAIRRLNELQAESAELIQMIEHEPMSETPSWPPKTFYWWYHVITGSLLGAFGAITSLLVNIVGSVITGQHPLQLIRVFLTFPMGDSAFKTDTDLVLLFGVGLYILTGSLYGILFEVIMARYFSNDKPRKRFIVATIIGFSIWIVNFYFILSWLQPMLFGGTWILSMIPPWVAALTHLVFAWTMLVIGEWGHFEATDYKRQAMVRANGANSNG